MPDTHLTPEQVSRLYRVPLIDYGAGRRGVLLCSGAGLMMALMDARCARYCCDVDGLAADAPLPDAMLLLARYASPLLVAGWWSHHSPRELASGVRLIAEHGLGDALHIYVGGRTAALHARQHDQLADFLRELERA